MCLRRGGGEGGGRGGGEEEEEEAEDEEEDEEEAVFEPGREQLHPITCRSSTEALHHRRA